MASLCKIHYPSPCTCERIVKVVRRFAVKIPAAILTILTILTTLTHHNFHLD